jgi:hypothetical protein
MRDQPIAAFAVPSKQVHELHALGHALRPRELGVLSLQPYPSSIACRRRPATWWPYIPVHAELGMVAGSTQHVLTYE